MLATLVAEPFHRDGWIDEEKCDGWRVVVHKDGPRAWPVSRTGRDHAGRFPEIAETAAGSGAHRSSFDAARAGTGPRTASLGCLNQDLGSRLEKGIRPVGISPAATQVST